MKKIYFLVIVFTTICLIGLAQSIGGASNVSSLDINTNFNGLITEVKPDKLARTLGNYFLYEEWNFGDIQLENGSSFQSPCRLHLKDNLIQFKKDGKVYSIDGKNVARFTLYLPNGSEEVYLQAKGLKIFDSNANGFISRISEGTWSLVKQVYIQEDEAVYISTLDAGRNEVNLVKKNKYYLLNNTTLTPINKSKKNLIANLIDLRDIEKVKEYLDQKRGRLTDVQYLISLVNFLNESGI